MSDVNPFFEHKQLRKELFRDRPDFNINDMYGQVVAELGLQQSKRDQLITIYLAAFAFVVPAMLSKDINNAYITGGVFVLLGIIGYLFALIIIRYRKYKEIYWLCCRTLNVMMDMDKSTWNKANIQGIFYNCMCKKISGFLTPIDQHRNAFDKKTFVKRNMFSSETLYLVIHAIITGCITGCGVAFLVPLAFGWQLLIGAPIALAMIGVILYKYFKTLVELYQVCEDGLDSSFNNVYKDAWFLHFFISRKDTNT